MTMTGEEGKKRPRSEEDAGENTGEETAEPPVKTAKTEDSEDPPTENAGEAPASDDIAAGEEDLFGDSEAAKEDADVPTEETNGAEKPEETATEDTAEPETKTEEAETAVEPPASEGTASETKPSQEASASVTEAVETAAPAPAPVTVVPVPVAAPAATVTAAAPAISSAGPVDPAAQATVVNPNSVIEERGEIAAQYVGRVIGKGGEMIRDLQARSGCRVDVDQNVAPGQPRIVTYRGTRKTVDFAKHLVAMLCSENSHTGPDLPLGEAARKQIVVPSSSIGKVIGRRGDMIRDLQSRSHAKIQVDHSGTSGIDPSSRQITITGTQEAVVKAEEMIMFLVANPLMDAMTAITMLVDDKTQNGGVWGSGPPYPNLQNQGQNMQMAPGYGAPQEHQGYSAGGGGYGGGVGGYQQQASGYGQYGGGVNATEVEIFPAAKMYMGRIIGQKGVTINDLQRRSGCDIQINQDVAPGQDCEITLKGSRQGIESAKQMLREVIETGPNHPYAGGGPPGGGGYSGQQGGYGGQQGGYQQAGYQPSGYQQTGYDQQQPPSQYQPQQHVSQQLPVSHQPYGQQYQAPQYGQPPQQYPAQPPHQPYGGAQQPYGYGQQPQAAMPVPAPMASPWKSAAAADGQVYYYNERTGETQWEKPVGML